MNYLIFKHPTDMCWNIMGTKYSVLDNDLIDKSQSKSSIISDAFDAGGNTANHHGLAILACLNWILDDALTRGQLHESTVSFHVDPSALLNPGPIKNEQSKAI